MLVMWHHHQVEFLICISIFWFMHSTYTKYLQIHPIILILLCTMTFLWQTILYIFYIAVYHLLAIIHDRSKTYRFSKHLTTRNSMNACLNILYAGCTCWRVASLSAMTPVFSAVISIIWMRTKASQSACKWLSSSCSRSIHVGWRLRQRMAQRTCHWCIADSGTSMHWLEWLHNVTLPIGFLWAQLFLVW